MKWEVLRKKMTERCGKSLEIYSERQVKMARVTVNLLILQNMNPVAHSCLLHGFPTVL